MITTVKTKDVGDVKDKFYGSYKWQLENGIEEYVKREIEVENGL